MGIGGTDISAIAAAYAALKNPAVLSHLILISPPLGKGQAQKQLGDYQARFRTARLLPRRIFQSVGRYEIPSRYAKPARALAQVLLARQAEKADVEYKFTELGSGHGLVAFKSILPEAFAHTFPPEGS
jgi:pimeloyl-ACP methyl ester carboxylesterase